MSKKRSADVQPETPAATVTVPEQQTLPLPPRYVLRDVHGYYAIDEPGEGWLFVVYPDQATRFETREAAEQVMAKHYRDVRMSVVQV